MFKTISSAQHPLVKHMAKLRQNRDYRYDHHRIIVEGITLISDLAPVLTFRTIIARDEHLIPAKAKADEIIIGNDTILKKISGLESSEGIIAEVDMPQQASLTGKRRIIALDGVNDPGNFGTLLRSALALGWDGAFILEDSCDPFNEKAIRAARGATFRLPLAWGSWTDLDNLIKKNKLVPLVADIKGEKIDKIESSENTLLVLGNEARGPSQAAKEAGRAVTIEMQGNMESLNVAVAGSILMYMLRQNRGKNEAKKR